MVSGRTEGVVLAIFIALIWGFTPIMMKAGLLAFSGSLITSVRLVASFVILFSYVKLTGGTLPLRSYPRLAIAAGVASAANYFLFITGLELTTAISSEFIFQFGTILMVLTGVMLFHERMNSVKALGTLMSVAGVWVIVWNGADLPELLGQSSFLGNLLILAAAGSWVIYGYSQVVLNRNHSSSQALLLILFPAAMVSLLAAPTYKVSSVDMIDLLVLGVLILTALVPYVFLARSFKRIESSTAVVITTLATLVTPLGVSLFGFFDAPFVRGESVTMFTVVGGALILSGIFLAAKLANRRS